MLFSQAGFPFDTVQVQNREAARNLAGRLFELGYRRPVIFAGPSDVLTAAERVTGFQEGWADHGIEVDSTRLIHGDFTRDGGYVAAGEFLGQAIDADVILAVNDVMAVGAMARLREAGYSLPDQIAITGFDDIHTLRDVAPSLTTVRLPLETMGSGAVTLALKSTGEGAAGHRGRRQDGDPAEHARPRGGQSREVAGRRRESANAPAPTAASSTPAPSGTPIWAPVMARPRRHRSRRRRPRTGRTRRWSP